MRLRVGLIGTGEMGSAVGGRLVARGVEVVTSLAGRSAASAERIARAGIEPVAGEDDVVRESAFVLSIVPPGQARAVAEQFAPALARANPKPVFVDCNAVAAATVRAIAAIVERAGAPFVDAGIVGGPPKDGYAGPNIYAAGDAAAAFARLGDHGLAVRVLDGPVGTASGLKMCYAGITKGLTGIGAAMLAAAARNGLGDALRAELASSQPALAPWLERQVPGMFPKAYRWVAEMREIGAYDADEPGVAAIYEGLAAFYAAIAERRAAGTGANGRG
jgi:3-hydroxyisobutyrate dehydrogenase-like beta-hydroxyacid dehydrogenase